MSYHMTWEPYDISLKFNHLWSDTQAQARRVLNIHDKNVASLGWNNHTKTHTILLVPKSALQIQNILLSFPIFEPLWTGFVVHQFSYTIKPPKPTRSAWLWNVPPRYQPCMPHFRPSGAEMYELTYPISYYPSASKLQSLANTIQHNPRRSFISNTQWVTWNLLQNLWMVRFKVPEISWCTMEDIINIQNIWVPSHIPKYIHSLWPGAQVAWNQPLKHGLDLTRPISNCACRASERLIIKQIILYSFGIAFTISLLHAGFRSRWVDGSIWPQFHMNM